MTWTAVTNVKHITIINKGIIIIIGDITIII